MKNFWKILSVLLLCGCLEVSAGNAKPFVVPELKEWKGQDGFFVPGKDMRVVYGVPELEKVAELFADDYREMFGKRLEVISGKPSDGDIFLTIKKDKKLGKEGYTVSVAKHVRVSASEPDVKTVNAAADSTYVFPYYCLDILGTGWAVTTAVGESGTPGDKVEGKTEHSLGNAGTAYKFEIYAKASDENPLVTLNVTAVNDTTDVTIDNGNLLTFLHNSDEIGNDTHDGFAAHIVAPTENNTFEFPHIYRDDFETIFTAQDSLDSYDEISLTDEFKVMTRRYERIYRPQDLGFMPACPDELSGGCSRESAARIFDQVLQGQATPAQQQCVIVNAAFAIQVLEHEKEIAECISLARESLESGRALKMFRKFIEINS